MAQAGFPWSAQSQIREPSYIDEKIAEEAVHKQSVSTLPEKREAPSFGPPSHKLSISQGVATRHVHLPFQPHGKRDSSSHGRRRATSLKNRDNPRPVVQEAGVVGGGREGASRAPVRTIPPWIQDADESDLEDYQIDAPSDPEPAVVAQHNHTPAASRRPLLASNQRKREAYPTSSGRMRPERTSRWISFARASAYPRENFHGEEVDADYLDRNFTDYSKPWLADHQEDEEDEEEGGTGRYRAYQKRKRVWYRRIQFIIFRNPFVPLGFRITVIIFACVAIGLGSAIYRETGKIVDCIHMDVRTQECRDLVGTENRDYYRDPSGLMAVIVDAIAVAYSLYITYDEYFSKPLGLRSARAKVRLVLLDLFFIVFQSANLSLSFESLTVDEGACQIGSEPETSYRFDNVCGNGKALSGVLLVSLVAWLMTFSVSVLRLVERINTR